MVVAARSVILMTVFTLIASAGDEEPKLLVMKRTAYNAQLKRVHQAYLDELTVALKQFATRTDKESLATALAFQAEMARIREVLGVPLEDLVRGKLVIVKATYGLSPTISTNVTKQLQEMITDDQLVIKAGTPLYVLFGDPAPGHPSRTLVVQYRLEGTKTETVSFSDGVEVRLPLPSKTRAEPSKTRAEPGVRR